MVQVKVHRRLIVGYLSDNCTRVTGTGSGHKAKVFKSSKAANQAAKKCLLTSRKPRA